jgi:topoisomerase DNA-binding C4 zinc finger domain protein
MDILLYFLTIPIILVIIIKAIVSDSGSSKNSTLYNYRYSRKYRIMTEREQEFYKKLKLICGDSILIFPQIHLSNLFFHNIKGQNFKSAFKFINKLSVDFVLVDSRNFKTLMAIELDDSTHNDQERIRRDLIVNDIFKKANFPLLRVDSIKIDNEKLKQMILENIKIGVK